MADNWAAIAKVIADMLEANTPYEAEVNAQNLNVPGYWVTPVSREFNRLGAGSTLIFDIYAISNPRGGADEALEQLSDMQQAVRDLPPPLNGQGNSAEVASVLLNNKAADALPALKMTIQVEDE